MSVQAACDRPVVAVRLQRVQPGFVFAPLRVRLEPLAPHLLRRIDPPKRDARWRGETTPIRRMPMLLASALLHGAALAAAIAFMRQPLQPISVPSEAVLQMVFAPPEPATTAVEQPAVAQPASEPPPPAATVPEPEPAPAVQATEPPPPPAPPPSQPVTTRPVPARPRPAPAARPSVPSPPPSAGERTAPPSPVIPARPVAGMESDRPPVYPESARRRGQQGRVMLRVEVSADGSPLAVTVANSSGYPSLDSAALSAVQRWRFVPATRGGQAVSAIAEVPVHFQLTD